MALLRDRVDCPTHLDHTAVERARKRLSGMSTPDLFEWARNCALDVSALVDRVRENPDDVDSLNGLILADAMVHACVCEISDRKKR